MVFLLVQNSRQIEIHNNNFEENLSGLRILANFRTTALRMEIQIYRNVSTTIKWPLITRFWWFVAVISPYQQALIHRNWFLLTTQKLVSVNRPTSQFVDNILLERIVGNFYILYYLGFFNLFWTVSVMFSYRILSFSKLFHQKFDLRPSGASFDWYSRATFLSP